MAPPSQSADTDSARVGDDYNEAIGLRWSSSNRGRDIERVLGVQSDDREPNRPVPQHDQRPSARR